MSDALAIGLAFGWALTLMLSLAAYCIFWDWENRGK